jgi:beta-N-acetylhexosaminidase
MDPAVRQLAGWDIGVEVVTMSKSITRRDLLGSAVVATGLSLATPFNAFAETPARTMLRKLTLRERVAQMFFFEVRGKFMSPTYLADLKRVKPGGVLVVGPNIGTADQFRGFMGAIHATNEVIKPFICIDQEGGPVTRLYGDPAPGAVQMGQLSNRDVRLLNQQRAEFLAGFGLDVNFAPVADVAYDASSTMASRSFGSDPHDVAAKVAATVKGSRSGGVIGAAKHFPGHGRTHTDSHTLLPEIDVPWDEWLQTDAVPFKSAIEENVGLIMLGHLRYERIDYKPMSISKVAVRALRQDLGFDGVIVTDDLGMGALDDWDPFDVVSQAIDAGVDVLLWGSPPTGWDALIEHVIGMIRAGIVSRQEINRRAEKVVALKMDHFGMQVT